MEGFVIGVIVLGGLGAAGVWRVARERLRAVRMLGMMGVVMVCLMSAAAEPPEKPIPKALPVADDEPQAKPLKKMIEEADKELAQKDKNGRAQKEETPLTRYNKLVISQVERKWHAYLHLRPDARTPGELQLVFYVNQKGKVEGLKVINDKHSTPMLTEVTKRAVEDAEIPPIPADVIPLLPKEDPKRLKIAFNVLLY